MREERERERKRERKKRKKREEKEPVGGKQQREHSGRNDLSDEHQYQVGGNVPQRLYGSSIENKR